MKFIIGTKIEMTQLFSEDGRVTPVTKVAVGPCTVVQVKTPERDGYSAVQFSYGSKKEKNIAKPQRGHNRAAGVMPRRLREMRVQDVSEVADVTPGQVIDVASFQPGDVVKVTGTSKGRGFQGVVKRHGFSGSLATHGHKDQHRMPGSVGSAGPAHVFKGTRMGGQMGNVRVSVKNMEIVQVDTVENVLYLKGAVPGARNNMVMITGDGELSYVTTETKAKTKIEDTPAEMTERAEAVVSEPVSEVVASEKTTTTPTEETATEAEQSSQTETAAADSTSAETSQETSTEEKK